MHADDAPQGVNFARRNTDFRLSPRNTSLGARFVQAVGRRARLRAIKTQKQASDGVPHSQREPAPPPVLLAVVKHMAALAKGLQISHPVIGGIMVEMRSRQDYPSRANCEVAAKSSNEAASASIAPRPLVFIPPSTIA